MKHFRQFGFTLIELLIVISMTALLATVMLANFRDAEKQKRVQLTLDSATNTTRLAQNYTLTGKQIPRASGCLGDNSASYYRVVFAGSATSIPLYADDKCAEAVTIDQLDFLANVRIRPSAIALETCNPSCSTATVDSIHVRFTPPFGIMTISTDGLTYAPFSKADITFEYADGTRAKVLRIDGVSGRVGN